jgi:serine kinase of HPr protein (carbohydrate metabolism regulator)
MLRESAPGLACDGDPAIGAPHHALRVVLHASCVDLLGIGVALLGPPGAGKSDLALRLIDGGARLVSDDRLVVERHGDVLIGRAVDAIAGLIEVRGLGIMRIDHCASTRLGLVVALAGAAPLPRLPERSTYELLGVALPFLELDPRTPSACAKVRLALTAQRVA